MTVFNCKILITDTEYREYLLQYDLISLLQDRIYKKFNLTKHSYSLYRLQHNLMKTEKEGTKEIITEHIFDCILHIFE